MSRERITSRSNPLLVRLGKLNARRPARREAGLFVCEGPKLLAEALQWGAAVDTVICAEGLELPALPDAVRIVEVPDSLLTAVADTRTPQGIIFLCRGSVGAMPERPAGSRYLILDGVQDPGNVGAIWRTADAFGADGLILCGGCADPWSPKTVRATMGAIFRLPVYEQTLEETAERLKAAGIPLYATALREDTADVRTVPLSRSGVIIGSEGHGVSEDALRLCERTIKIPMTRRCESLNAAVAAAVVLWEMAR